MPTEAENTMFLYLVLTHDNTPSINWDLVSAALDLKKGAVSKRWSRLKQAMDKGKEPSGNAYSFLWLCVKHSNRDTGPDWNAIAQLAGTSPGAASKRYSRMKQAFESGTDAPDTLAKTLKTPRSTTAKKAQTLDNNAAPDSIPSKRKRAPAKSSTVKKDDAEDAIRKTELAEADEVDDDGMPPTPSKKLRKTPAKTKVAPRSKAVGEEHESTTEEEATSDTTPPTSPGSDDPVKAEPGEHEEEFFDAEDEAADSIGCEV